MSVGQYEDDIRKEYGRYRAKKAIYIGGARAFNPGDPVPQGHLTSQKVRPDEVEDLEVKPTTPTTKKEG